LEHRGQQARERGISGSVQGLIDAQSFIEDQVVIRSIAVRRPTVSGRSRIRQVFMRLRSSAMKIAEE
jgi:hypothetical protein